jgi:succinate-semialdehyde dehydrogenase / glutarate-semialdehyde dehydrogenase
VAKVVDQPAGLTLRLPPAAVLQRWVAGVPVLGERTWLGVDAPFTGGRILEVPRCEAADMAEAVRRARVAQQSWADVPPKRRARVLLRLHDLLLERTDAIVDLIQLETGKARLYALDEVLDAVVQARHYAHRGPKLLKTRRRKPAFPVVSRAWLRRVPIGVVGVLAPWNYPLVMSLSESLAALLAGNAVVVKPDPQTPLSAFLARDLLEEAGLPAELFQVVTGDGPVTGGALIDHCDYIAFTGSTATGRVVARRAAERLIDCTLELGGKNPLIVLDDADIDRAAAGAVRGSFASSGQLCVSAERILVVASVYDAFVERLLEHARSLRLGASFDFSCDMGCITSSRQLERIEAHVADALGKGATVLFGGRRRPDLGPLFYEPTILTGVTPDMELWGEETFGPVISLFRVRDEEEAITRANELPYGLNASVWTRSSRRGRRVAARIHAGSVNINDVFYATWGAMDAPLGGFKESGYGRRHGDEGLLSFTLSQAVAEQRWIDLAPPAWLGGQRFMRLVSLYMRAIRRIPFVR